MQKFHSPDSDQSCRGSALELLLMRPRNQCYEEFGWLGIHSWTRNTNSNKHHFVPYSNVLHILSSASRAELKQLLSAHYLLTHQVNHSRKMLHSPKSVTHVYNKRKTKVHYKLWGECSGLSELTYLTGKYRDCRNISVPMGSKLGRCYWRTLWRAACLRKEVGQHCHTQWAAGKFEGLPDYLLWLSGIT